MLGAYEVCSLSEWATDALWPDLTILLDLDPAEGERRRQAVRTGYDRLEAEAADFHRRVRDGFLALASAEPHRFLVVDAAQPIDAIAVQIRERVSALLSQS